MHNSRISPKIGLCVDCTDGVEKPIIAGRCRWVHYKLHRTKMIAQKKRLKSKVAALGRTEVNKILIPPKKDWFMIKREEMKGVCENCGEPSPKENTKYYKWGICHILPKEHFGSIAWLTDVRIWWEACIPCHTRYDRNWYTAEQMPIFPELVRRFKLFQDRIAEDERKRIPECFTNETIPCFESAKLLQ